MNEELKDRGLKKAVREQTTFRLPSNFTDRTMQKVEEAICLREEVRKKNSACNDCRCYLLDRCQWDRIGSVLRRQHPEVFTPTTLPQLESIQIPCFYLLLILTIPLFNLFDRWMRKLYFKTSHS